MPVQLKNILRALGYDNTNLISDFCDNKSEDTFKKVELFMKTKSRRRHRKRVLFWNLQN